MPPYIVAALRITIARTSITICCSRAGIVLLAIVHLFHKCNGLLVCITRGRRAGRRTSTRPGMAAPLVRVGTRLAVCIGTSLIYLKYDDSGMAS
ncbi:hypothetical protein BC826DRAFT_517479 [Russula brevipes]|nr:hypothetical protein BC826DRAFT_517479 [Russula brevipes]